MATERPTRNHRRLLVGLAAGATTLAVILGIVVLGGNGDDNALATNESDPTTDSGATGHSTASESTTTSRPVEVDTSTVVWPWETTTTRYDDPTAAVRSFATEFVGFTNPVVGPFRQGDGRSGEVDVRPRSDGPITTVLVRQLEDGHWWVVGSVTELIQLDSPTTGDSVGSPVRLTGRANAYEGHVSVLVKQDGHHEPVGVGFVTGCQGNLCPFDDRVSFASPTAGTGALVMLTSGGEDDGVWEALVVRVAFAAGGDDEPSVGGTEDCRADPDCPSSEHRTSDPCGATVVADQAGYLEGRRDAENGMPYQIDNAPAPGPADDDDDDGTVGPQTRYRAGYAQGWCDGGGEEPGSS